MNGLGETVATSGGPMERLAFNLCRWAGVYEGGGLLPEGLVAAQQRQQSQQKPSPPSNTADAPSNRSQAPSSASHPGDASIQSSEDAFSRERDSILAEANRDRADSRSQGDRGHPQDNHRQEELVANLMSTIGPDNESADNFNVPARTAENQRHYRMGGGDSSLGSSSQAGGSAEYGGANSSFTDSPSSHARAEHRATFPGWISMILSALQTVREMIDPLVLLAILGGLGVIVSLRHRRN